jgi:hypothetical protein
MNIKGDHPNLLLETARRGDVETLRESIYQLTIYPYPLPAVKTFLSDLLRFVNDIRDKSERAKILESVTKTILPLLGDEGKQLRSKWERLGRELDGWRHLVNIWCDLFRETIVFVSQIDQDESRVKEILSLTRAFRSWFRLSFEGESGRVIIPRILEKFVYDLRELIRQIKRIEVGYWQTKAVETLSLLMDAMYSTRDLGEAIKHLEKILPDFERISEDQAMVKRLGDIITLLAELPKPAAAESPLGSNRDPSPRGKRRGGCVSGGSGESRSSGDHRKSREEKLKELNAKEAKEKEEPITSAKMTKQDILTLFQGLENVYRKLTSSDISPVPTREREKEVLPQRETGDSVNCSIFSPPSIPKGEILFVQVFVHLPKQKKIVEEEAKLVDSDTIRRGSKRLKVPIEIGSRLTFHLTMSSLIVKDPVQELTWQGEPESVQFEVTVPHTYKMENLIGTVTVCQDSVPIGQIKFNVKVMSAGQVKSKEAELTGRAVAFNNFFISYASKDRLEVIKRLQMLLLMGKRFFLDLLNLDPGERWKRKLYLKIRECDAVLLFWSSNAKNSKWVIRECKYTIEEKGIDRLIPVIIEGPPPVEPPPLLEELHMNDYLLYFQKS